MTQFPFFVVRLLLYLALLGSSNARKIDTLAASGASSIIPRPASIVTTAGHGFEITARTRLLAPSGLPAARFLNEKLKSAAGFELKAIHGARVSRIGKNYIAFVRVPMSKIPHEGYTLVVKKQGVTIGYSDNAGALYGFESLRELLPAEIESSKPVKSVHWLVPPVVIRDAPRFAWRGMMLDVSRHFFPVPFIKRYLDFLAMNKMNVFHWHLVDDGGWRIQIDKYPKLTEVGARRYGVTQGWDQSKLRFDSASGLPEYGGLYTKAQIRDVVRYAADRGINIVPEIEMPGHSMAAVAAYPELACLNIPPNPQEGQPASNVYCAGNPETYKFLESVLTEVMELFPSKWIHLGGDEVDKRFWHVCPRCQAMIQAHGLANEDALQSYFVHHFDQFLAAHGRRLIGWDEILEGGLAPGATVMSWRGIDGGIAAAKAGHDVVMSPTSHCYFDYPYETTPTELVYSYDPVPAALTDTQSLHVLGGQANEWTERIPTDARAEYMIFPRILAMSEVLWSPKAGKDYQGFSQRLLTMLPRLDAQHISYHLDAPAVTVTAVTFEGSTKVDPGFNQAQAGTVRYTRDGSTPNLTSAVYDGPIFVNTDCDLKFAIVTPSGYSSDVSQISCRHAEVMFPPRTGKGWAASYYPGLYHTVPDFSQMQPASADTAEKISADVLVKDDTYALKFYGLFYLASSGIYTFSLSSDDGSVLKVGGAKVVDNDGEHGTVTKTGRIFLTNGWHSVEVGYFQAGGAKSLALSLLAPGATEPIPLDGLVWHP